MTEHRLVHFTTTGPAADRQLVQEYVLEAVDRLERHPACQGLGFTPAGQKPGIDGLVLLQIVGDTETVIEHERDRWDALVDAGLAEDWTTETVDPAAQWGDNGAALRSRLDTLAARLSKLVYEAFDTRPHPVDEHPREVGDRETPTGVGWWTLLHILTLQQGYSYDEEIEAYTEGMRDALYKTIQYEGFDIASEKIDEVIESLEALRGEARQSADGTG